MSQSNYKEELRKIFNNLVEEARDKGTATDGSERESYALQDALAAIDRLNASTIGEDETLDDCPIEKHLCPKVDRNQLRSELRQKFGVVNTDIDVGIKKEE